MTSKFCKVEHKLLDRVGGKISGGAGWTLMLIWRRHKKATDKKIGQVLYDNNGQIPCTKRDVMRWCRCADHAALRYLKELQTAGLITCTKKGEHHVYTGGAYGTPSTWRLNFL